MVSFTKVNGKMTKQMVMVFIKILTIKNYNILGSGIMIFNMDMEWKNGLMEVSMKETILKEIDKEKVKIL